MVKVTRWTAGLAFVAHALLLATGCKTAVGPQDEAGEVSLVASVVGIDAKDVARTNLTYSLICNGGSPLLASKAPSATDSTVNFASAGIKDKDQCALEIRVAPSDPNFANWLWYGVKSGQPDSGLMYGSNVAPVSGGKLALTLYRLYAERPSGTAPSFNLKIFAQIDQSAGALPAKAILGGNLTCDSGVAQMVATLVQATPDGKGYEFDFQKEDLATYAGKHCTGLALTVNGVPGVFTGTAADVSLINVVQDQVLAFPLADGSKFETLLGSACLTTKNGVCQDVHALALPYALSYLLAKVQGTQAGKPVTLWVSAAAVDGSPGLGLYPGTALATADLNLAVQTQIAAASGGTTPLNTLQLAWYKSDGTLEALFDTTPSGLAGAAFDSHFTGAAPFLANPAGDLSGLTVLHIVELWVHGFHPVDAAALNSKANATWVADIVGTKAGVPNAEFLVGGGGRYFTSANVPSTSADGKGLYFDAAKIASDMTTNGGLWSVYALKNAAMAPAGCAAVDKSYYLATFSSRTLTTLTGPGAAPDPTADGCRVTPDVFVPGIFSADWTLAATYYAWEWFVPGT